MNNTLLNVIISQPLVGTYPYLDAFFTVGDGRFEFAKASQLPTIIANEHQELVNMKQLLKKETAECRKLQTHYYEVISVVELLCALILSDARYSFLSPVCEH